MFAITFVGLLLVFAITAIVSGVWQIKYGTRNKTLIYITFGLMVVFMALVVTQVPLKPEH